MTQSNPGERPLCLIPHLGLGLSVMKMVQHEKIRLCTPDVSILEIGHTLQPSKSHNLQRTFQG